MGQALTPHDQFYSEPACCFTLNRDSGATQFENINYQSDEHNTDEDDEIQTLNTLSDIRMNQLAHEVQKKMDNIDKLEKKLEITTICKE